MLSARQQTAGAPVRGVCLAAARAGRLALWGRRSGGGACSGADALKGRKRCIGSRHARWKCYLHQSSPRPAKKGSWCVAKVAGDPGPNRRRPAPGLSGSWVCNRFWGLVGGCYACAWANTRFCLPLERHARPQSTCHMWLVASNAGHAPRGQTRRRTRARCQSAVHSATKGQ